MVFNTMYYYWNRFIIFDNCTNIGIKFIFYVAIDKFLAVFCMKYNVNNVCVLLFHKNNIIRRRATQYNKLKHHRMAYAW
jgi:hypothetical protein